MSLDQITVYTSRIEKGELGYAAISLTEMDSTSEPQIAAGSKVEINGALFEAAALESFTGWSGIGNSTDVYMKLTVSGSTATASFVTAAPTWSTSKQGWYNGSDRYIGGLYKDGSGNYALKWLYPADPSSAMNQEMIRGSQTRPLLEMVLTMGDWNMDANGSTTVQHTLPNSKIRGITGIIRSDVDTYYYSFPGFADSADPDLVGVGVSILLDTGYVQLRRRSSGFFDDPGFDSTSFNRGWVYIKYRA